MSSSPPRGLPLTPKRENICSQAVPQRPWPSIHESWAMGLKEAFGLLGGGCRGLLIGYSRHIRILYRICVPTGLRHVPIWILSNIGDVDHFPELCYVAPTSAD